MSAFDDEDDVATQVIKKLTWLPPVPSAADLPTEGVKEGTCCFVEAEDDEDVWQYRKGTWVRTEDL